MEIFIYAFRSLKFNTADSTVDELKHFYKADGWLYAVCTVKEITSSKLPDFELDNIPVFHGLFNENIPKEILLELNDDLICRVHIGNSLMNPILKLSNKLILSKLKIRFNFEMFISKDPIEDSFTLFRPLNKEEIKQVFSFMY